MARSRPRGVARDKSSTLPAESDENISVAFDGVVVEFEPVLAPRREQPFMDAADFHAASFDASEGIIHADFAGRIPVLLHQIEVAAIQGAIKLREGGQWRVRVVYVLVPSDWLLDRQPRHAFPFVDR
jgi:hypothetical protein